jgi:uncharacterized RDD family membrane protein YckC
MEQTNMTPESESSTVVDSVAVEKVEAPTVAYTGFWRRLVGFTIDYLILIIIVHFVSSLYASVASDNLMSIMLAGFLSNSSLTYVEILKAVAIVFGLLLTYFIIFALYYCSFEVSKLQATPGKYIVGIKVTDLNGEKITLKRSLIRRVSALLSSLTIFIGYLMAAFTKKKQTLHDKLAHTLVVNKSKRNGFLLFVIFVVTVAVGIISDRTIGAGFHFSFNTPTSSYNTTSGSVYSITLKGGEVDSDLKEAIINGYKKQQEIMVSGDVEKMRKFMIDSTVDPEFKTRVESASDEDIKKTSDLFIKIGQIVTETELRKPDSVWKFNEQKTKVKISIVKKNDDGNSTPATSTFYVTLVNVNGVWY